MRSLTWSLLPRHRAKARPHLRCLLCCHTALPSKRQDCAQHRLQCCLEPAVTSSAASRRWAVKQTAAHKQTGAVSSVGVSPQLSSHAQLREDSGRLLRAAKGRAAPVFSGTSPHLNNTQPVKTGSVSKTTFSQQLDCFTSLTTGQCSSAPQRQLLPTSQR